jgi:hypothetical protein
MKRSMYHLHIDALELTSPLVDWMTSYGFVEDFFPHSYQIENKSYHPRHFTKVIEDLEPNEIKIICQDILKKMSENPFKGLLQVEYLMLEKELQGSVLNLNDIAIPFKITLRKLDKNKGEFFKQHEIHFECQKKNTHPLIIKALMGIGFHFFEAHGYYNFTCAGFPKELLLIRHELEKFISDYGRYISGTLSHEATVFFQNIGLEPEDMPEIVSEIYH